MTEFKVPEGSIKFHVRDDGPAVMEMRPDGDIFIRGEKVDSNPEVYQEFRAWMDAARATPLEVQALRAEVAGWEEVSKTYDRIDADNERLREAMRSAIEAASVKWTAAVAILEQALAVEAP